MNERIEGINGIEHGRLVVLGFCLRDLVLPGFSGYPMGALLLLVPDDLRAKARAKGQKLGLKLGLKLG